MAIPPFEFKMPMFIPVEFTLGVTANEVTERGNMSRRKIDVDLERRASELVNTSVDDCKSSLPMYNASELPVLERALAIAKQRKEKTRPRYIQSRINQLQKSA